MKTHVVEIRLIGSPPGPWERLTKDPVTRRDAMNLSEIIGPAWESRIVALSSPMGTQFAELERRFGKGIKRWEAAQLNHHPECGVPLVPERETWETAPFGGNTSDVMTGTEWLNLQRIRQVVTALHDDRDAIGARRVACDYSPTVHAGRCKSCGATARALSVAVQITVPGDGAVTKTTSREYAL